MLQEILRGENLAFKTKIQYPDFVIQQNQTTFITGPSGVGKSTLLKILNATVEPSSGNVFYKNTDSNQIDTLELRKNILLVNQNTFLFEGTIYENYKQYYEYRKQSMPTQEKIKQYLQLCCVPFEIDAVCDTMSGGEKQRVFISIFLSFAPTIFMLDEPTSALDDATGTKMMQNIVSYCEQQDITIVAISHDANLVKKFAKNTIQLG